MSDLSVALDKVRKLVALSTSPYAEEARTAAYKAAELIRMNGFKVVYGNAPDTPEPVIPHVPKPPKRTPEDGIMITSKWSGTCRWCGEEYTVGDRILWQRKRGCWHFNCAMEDEELGVGK